jgi:hypothetical protein
MWPTENQARLKSNINLILKENRNYCYLNPTVLSGESSDGVFNPTYFDDVSSIVKNNWTQLKLEDSYHYPCVYIITAHGSDISSLIWDLRAIAHQKSVFCLWHFDNHVAYFDNYKAAISCDFNFISHNAGVPGYLTNSASCVVAHIPLCCVQFGINEIKEYALNASKKERISKGLFNYITYENAPRTSLIRQLSQELGDLGEFKLMPSEDRSRYWSMSREERVCEWGDYKCSVIIPLVEDLSTRVFDALATGQIPIIPESVLDLDSAIPIDTQRSLGIVKIKDLSTENVTDGIKKAINNFDQAGPSGVIDRIEYFLNNATAGHRLALILNSIESIGSDNEKIIFGRGPNGTGLYISKN